MFLIFISQQMCIAILNVSLLSHYTAFILIERHTINVRIFTYLLFVTNFIFIGISKKNSFGSGHLIVANMINHTCIHKNSYH